MLVLAVESAASLAWTEKTCRDVTEASEAFAFSRCSPRTICTRCCASASFGAPARTYVTATGVASGAALVSCWFTNWYSSCFASLDVIDSSLLSHR